MFTETLAECNTLKPKIFTAETQRKIRNKEWTDWDVAFALATLSGYLQVGADRHAARLSHIFEHIRRVLFGFAFPPRALRLCGEKLGL